jgi:hypothetical protein
MTASSPSQLYLVAGILLLAGSAVLAVGVILYALLPNDLALPAASSSYPNALKEATQHVDVMKRAGQVIFFGDMLVAAAALALLPRKRYERLDLERVGWALIFVAFLPAFVFDSMMASALPNAAAGVPASFGLFKSWFDVQFAAGNIIFGLGGSALFFADSAADEPTLPRVIDYLAVAVAVTTFVGGLGYLLGLFVGWQLPDVRSYWRRWRWAPSGSRSPAPEGNAAGLKPARI